MTIHQKQQIYKEYRVIARRYVKEILIAIAHCTIDKHSFTLLLRNHATERAYKLSIRNKRSIKTVEMYVTLLCEINKLLILDEHATKRDIYYRHPSIFKNQMQLDHALDNIACTFDIPRDALNIHASAKGLVHGDLRIGLETGVLDCSNGILIPRDDLVMSVEFEGRFVLVVEKDAIFHTIAADHDHLEKVFGSFALITVPHNSCLFDRAKGIPILPPFNS